MTRLAKPKRDSKRLPDPHGPGSLSVTDGQQTAGTVVRQGDNFFAFDAAGKFLGISDTLIEAARRIPAAKPAGRP